MTTIIVACIAALAAILSAYISARQSKRINETHKQVTVNSHSSAQPTILDLISDVREDINDLKHQVTDLKASGTNGLLHHLEWHMKEGNVE